MVVSEGIKRKPAEHRVDAAVSESAFAESADDAAVARESAGMCGGVASVL
ncbi:uncharacterized protein PGTG_21132 [Puccinia graminis f. sp. tritici CRL 75-36-700-3]|uniref:Uncharacterized protein n=1 Tax=Puccinia graminis f. sp. tritici (strain CRL 75-36-700-3 / race SCCL) TaxID=418459 RepID=H6QQR3_PUCGT|nr:uncharacterized protein PGTG_21132 [Puccinia graminis f. sp. tritici CRL 75-36-700-3]EHS62811.1 hypothetical protein PGTG_21132 [Puccinia graminis f. sp. tritici CRL 75-36-700-3]